MTLCVFLSSAFSFGRSSVPITTRMLGSWRGEGHVMGMESRIQMKWESVLGGKFVRLTWRNEMRAKQGKQVFEGDAYYQANQDGTYRGQWFDSGGEAHPISGKIESESLVADWGTKDTKQGRTVYRLLSENTMEVIDSVLAKDGQWKEFGRSKFLRE
jgi:hypothetical protein